MDALISGGVARTASTDVPAVASPVRPTTGTKPEQHPVPALPRGDEVLKLDINLIERSPLQPRTEFDPEHLKELADSIKQRGVIQPLLVRARRAA